MPFKNNPLFLKVGVGTAEFMLFKKNQILWGRTIEFIPLKIISVLYHKGQQWNSCPLKRIHSVLYVGEETVEFIPFQNNPVRPIHWRGNSGIQAPQKLSTLSYKWGGAVELLPFQKNPVCPTYVSGNDGIHALQKVFTPSYTLDGEQWNSWHLKCILYVLYMGWVTMDFMPFKMNPLSYIRGSNSCHTKSLITF